MTDLRVDDNAPQDTDTVETPNGPAGPKRKPKHPRKSSQVGGAEKGKGKAGGDDGKAGGGDGSEDFVEMAKSEDAQDQFSQALLGKDYAELTAQEQKLIDQLIEDILNGSIQVVVVEEGDGVVLEDGTDGGFRAGENGEPGTIYIDGDLTKEEREAALKEEYGEAIAHHAEELGLELPGGDAGERLLIVSEDGYVDLELTAELFEDRSTDDGFVYIDGVAVPVKTRQSVDADNNAALDQIEYFLAPREIGYGSRPNEIFVNQNGDIVIRGIDDDGSSFEITMTLGEDANGEPTLTIAGTRTNPDGTTEALFPTHTITGEDAVNNAIADVNLMFDEASIDVATGATSFEVEVDAETGKFSVVQSGNSDVDDALDHFLGFPVDEDGYTTGYDDEGNLIITGTLEDGSIIRFKVTFTVGADGEPVMVITGSIEIPGNGQGPQPIMAPLTVTGQDNITAVVGSMNDRFTDVDMTAPGDDQWFEIAPDFEAGGFYSLLDVDLTQTRVVFDDTPENAEQGDVVGEVEVMVNGRWVPLSELPPSYQDRVTVELSNSNGSLEVLPNGQIVVAETSGLINGLTVDVLITSDGTETTLMPIEYDVPIVDVDETFVPTQSDTGNFEVGKTTFGIPEGVDYSDPIILTGADAEVFGTSKAAVVTYEDADGNLVTVIIDADPASPNYMGVLTTIVEVAGEGTYIYDAQGTEIGFVSEAETDQRRLGALADNDTEVRTEELVDWASNMGTVTSSGSNTGMSWVYWTDSDGVKQVTYSYVDPATGEFVTSTAERGSQEAMDFAEARDLYESADRDQGLLGQQVALEAVGVAFVAYAYIATEAAMLAGGATADEAAAEADEAAARAKKNNTVFYMALPGTHSGYYNQQRADAIGLLSKHQDDDGVDTITWDVDPTVSQAYNYTEGDPIPPVAETQTPEEAAAIVEIDEAEEANKEAEKAIVAADHLEKEADHAEDEARLAEQKAAQNPDDQALQADATEKRADADAAREAADTAHEAALVAGEHALKETEEAVEAAQASGDPELIALANSQLEMLASLIVMYVAHSEENDARDEFLETRWAAFDEYPDGNFPVSVVNDIESKRQDWVAAQENRHLVTLSYLDSRKDNAELFLDMKSTEHERLVAVAKRARYEEAEAKKDYDDAVANGGDVDGTKAIWDEKKLAADQASSEAQAGEASFLEAEHNHTKSVEVYDTGIANADPNISAYWTFDPQDTTDGATPAVPTTETIVDKDVYTGPEIEAEFGTSAIMVATSTDGDVTTKTLIDVDPASATYGEVIGKVVETPGEGAVVYDGDGNVIDTMTQAEVDAVNGVTDDGSVGEDEGRNLTDRSEGDQELTDMIPAGGKEGEYYPGANMSFKLYTKVVDGKTVTYAIIKYKDADGNIAFATVELNDDAALGQLTRAQKQLDTGRAGIIAGAMGDSSSFLATLLLNSNSMLDTFGAGTAAAVGTYFAGGKAIFAVAGGAFGLYVLRGALSGANEGRLIGLNNLAVALNQHGPVWVPAVAANPANNVEAQEAGFDLNGDGEMDEAGPFDIVPHPNPNVGGVVIMFPNGLFLELGAPIVDAAGNFGFDPNGDGDVEVQMPDNAQIVQNGEDPEHGLPGQLGILIPAQVAGNPAVFVPLPPSENMVMGVQDGVPVIIFGNQAILIDPNVEWGFVQPDGPGGDILLNAGGVNVPLPADWALVPPVVVGGVWQIDLNGDGVGDLDLPTNFDPEFVADENGNPAINLGVNGINQPIDPADIIVDANGAIGIDLNNNGLVDLPIPAADFPLVFNAEGVGIMVGQPPVFQALNFPAGAGIGYDAVNGNYYVEVNGVQHNIGGDIPANAIVAGGEADAAGNIELELQFGLTGPVFQFTVSPDNVVEGPAVDPLPAGVPSGATPVAGIVVPGPGGGTMVTPATGDSWFLTALGVLVIISSTTAAP